MVRMALGTAAGGLFGYGWYAPIGCLTGTCLITGNPVLSTLYFGSMGWLFAGGGRVLRRWSDRLQRS